MNEIKQKAVRKDGDVTMCDLLNKEIGELTKQKEIEELTNQKEIEEMAIIDCQRVPKGLDCSACQFANVYNCNSYRMATRLYNAGYRNCKDKVVLAKEEYHEKQLKSMLYSQMQEENGQLRLENNDLEAENDKLKEEIRQASELKAETIKHTKMETAREILQELKTKAIENGNKNPIMGARVSERDLCELAKQYGVEVE